MCFFVVWVGMFKRRIFGVLWFYDDFVGCVILEMDDLKFGFCDVVVFIVE